MGNRVVISENVTVIGSSLSIYGGAANEIVKGTDLTVLSGTYINIFGGSKDVMVEGDVNLTVGGNTNSSIDITDTKSASYRIYGGSNKANDGIKGKINLTFTGNAKAHYIFGGSLGNGKINEINFNYTGGSSANAYGGSTNGDNQCDVNLKITGGNCQQVFGATENVSMTGNVNLSIVGGTISRRIYGGCYNEYTWSGYETSAFVTGRISVLIGGNANITLNYSEDDKGIFACSRIKSNKTEEVACIIFADETAYSKYNNKIGSTDGNSFLIGSNSNAADNICRHTYTANGDVITQTCTNVKGTTLSSTATATLSIEGSDFVENGKEIKPAKVTYSTGWEGPKVDVTYSNNINAGTATATAEINGVKVTKTFHIHGYETAFDAYGHKLVCSVCGDVKNSESHKLTYVDNGNGTHNQVCDCGYKTSAVSHSYANKSEGDYQWKECVCGNEIKGQKLVQEVYDWTVAQYTQNVDVENSLIKQKGATFWYYDADKVDEPTKANLYMVQNKGINNTALTCDAASIPSGNFRAIGTSKQDWNSMYVSMKGSDDVSKKYLQLGYDLGAKANITKIAFLGSDHDNHPKLMPYHYMISVANAEEDLFTSDAVLTEEYYNDAVTNSTNAVVFTPKTAVEGRFVAIRFIKTYQADWENSANSSNAYVRLAHMAVEGEYLPQTFTQNLYDWTVADYTSNINVDNSLIKDKGATFWYYNGVGEAKKGNLYLKQNSGVNNTALTVAASDIVKETFYGIGLSDKYWQGMYVSMKDSDDVTKKYLQLGYDIGKKTSISKIALFGSDKDSHAQLMPYHYMISVADEEADLFTENAVVNEFYNNATANGTNAVIFTPNEPVEGRFVAFRFIKTYQDAWTGASDTSAFVRLTHIAVEGCLHDNIVVKSDDVNHWRECSDCGEKFDVEKHEFTCTKIDDDTHKFLCSCGKSNTEEHNYRLENDKFICDDCNSSINAYKIKFNDLSGKTYYETYVSPTGLTQEQIAEAKESAPVIFGYTFTGEFDTDANLPVVADTTYTAQYTRESTKYTVEVNSVSGSHSGQYEFDTALKIADPNAKSWTVDNQLVGVGTDIKLYVAGDMTIIGSENEETNPGIAIIGNRMSNGRYFVMAVATPNGKTIQESGVIYSDGNREKVIKSSRGNSELFMTALNGAPSYITAKAYIKVDGVYYYSNIVSNIGFIVTPDDNNDQNDGFIGDNNSDTWD